MDAAIAGGFDIIRGGGMHNVRNYFVPFRDRCRHALASPPAGIGVVEKHIPCVGQGWLCRGVTRRGSVYLARHCVASRRDVPQNSGNSYWLG